MYGGEKGKNGGIRGGHFCILDIGVKFIPLRCTVVVMHTYMITHGTMDLSAWGGAFHVASSHFLRMKDARHVTALRRGVQRLTSEAVCTGLGGSSAAGAWPAVEVKVLRG